MDRLVRVDLQELQLTFSPNQPSTSTFRLTNLMHTMSVAVSLTTTNPTTFSFSHPLSILPPLSSSLFTLHLTHPSPHPPLSYPSDSLLLRTSMLPTGKASQDDLRRLFSQPGRQIFKDATLPITFIGDKVVEFLLCPPPNSHKFKTLEISFLLSKAISACTQSQIDNLLRISVLSGETSFVSALIDAGGNVNFRDFSGESLLSFPVNSGNFDVVRVLIESGCQVHDSNDLLLHRAAQMNRVDVMEILCRKNQNLVNSVDPLGQTPLHLAAFNGHLDALRYCISIGGDPDCVDYNGWTPLHCAAAEGHIEAVEFLLECCLFSKHAINKDGKTPFSLAVENGHEIPHLLDVLRLNDVLQRAARLGDVNAINSCIAQGAEVNGRDQNGWTPLHRAAFKGQIESVKALLTHEAQVDVVDDLGYTPLHCAIEAGHARVALHLIARGAKGSLKSIHDLSPINMDYSKNFPAYISPLLGKMEKA